MNCKECGTEVSDEAKYCIDCGTQAGVSKESYQVSGKNLIGKVKEILEDSKVKRIVVKNNKGNVLLSIPVTWGAAGAAALVFLAPWLAALGVIAGIVSRCTVEVERTTK